MGKVIGYTGLGIAVVLAAIVFIKKAIWDYYSSVTP